MALHPAIPMLRIFDVGLARAFYVEWLRFDIVFEHRHTPDAPLYLGLRRDRLQLHLTEHYGDTTPGTQIRVPVDDIAGFAAALAADPVPFATPGAPQDMPWGETVLTLTDPFGNRITFFESANA